MDKSEFKKPEQFLTLDQARIAVRRLPGSEHYISPDASSSVEIDAGIDRLIGETTKEMDGHNMLPYITYKFGWSDAESRDFFSQPEREPFHSKLNLSPDFKEREQQLLTLGRYSKLRYEVAQKAAEDEPTPENINMARTRAAIFRTFYEFSLYNLFQEKDFAFQDLANSISPEDRRAGKIKPAVKDLELLISATETVTQASGGSPDLLYGKALQATEGGNLALASSFLSNNSGEPLVRKVLESVVDNKLNNQDLEIKKLKLLWEVEAFSLEMGMDWETFLEVYGLPDSQTITDRLQAFITEPKLVAELQEHLAREVNDVYTRKAPNTPLNYWDLLSARAQFLNLPDETESLVELEQKKNKVWTGVAKLLPLAFVDTPRNHVEAPLRMGASQRAVNITYPNEDDKMVNVVSLNPRSSEKQFAQETGHELTHKVHAFVLTKAEAAGDLPEGATEHVSTAVKEELAQLVDRQVKALYHTPTEIGAEEAASMLGGDNKHEWSDLAEAIRKRRQAPYALTQQAVRLKMEELWKKGVRELTDEKAQELFEELSPIVERWCQAGLPIKAPYQNLRSNFDPLMPLDGLSYLVKYIVSPREPVHTTQVVPQSQEPQPLKMQDAFEQRFGKEWLSNNEARIVLLGLMGETGRNSDITTYGNFVLSADPNQLKTDLKRWGIDPEKIE